MPPQEGSKDGTKEGSKDGGEVPKQDARSNGSQRRSSRGSKQDELYLSVRVSDVETEKASRACITAWISGDEEAKRRTDVASVVDKHVKFENASLSFRLASLSDLNEKVLVLQLLSVAEEGDGEAAAFKADEVGVGEVKLDGMDEDKLKVEGIEVTTEVKAGDEGGGMVKSVISLIYRPPSRPSRPNSRGSVGSGQKARPPSGRPSHKRRSSAPTEDSIETTDSLVKRRVGAESPHLLRNPSEVDRLSPVRAKSAGGKEREKLPQLVSKPREAFGTPEGSEKSHWSDAHQQPEKEVWEVEDAMSNKSGEGSTKGRPISAGVRTAEINKLKAESRKVQELVNALKHDVDVRNDALAKCGVEIRELRQQNKELARDRHSLKKRLMEVEVQTRELMDLENLEELPRHELERRITLLTQRYRAEKRRSDELNDLRKKLQDKVVHFQQYYEKYNDLQKAHLRQAEYIQDLQTEMKKIDKYRKTARNQEKVIEKLEDLLEASVEDTKKARKVLQEHDKMVAHIEALEAELKELKEDVIPSKDQQLDQLRQELQNRGSASSEEVEKLRKENEELRQKGGGGGGKKKEKPSNWQKERLMLMMQRDKAEARNKSLEKQMVENQSAMSKEAAELRQKIRQLEDKLAGK